MQELIEKLEREYNEREYAAGNIGWYAQDTLFFKLTWSTALPGAGAVREYPAGRVRATAHPRPPTTTAARARPRSRAGPACVRPHVHRS